MPCQCIFRREKSTCTENQVHLHGGLVHFHKEDIERRIVKMSLLLSDALPRVKGYPKKVCLAGDKLFSEPPLDSGHPGWLSGYAGGPRWFVRGTAPGPRLAMIPARNGILSVRKTGTRGAGVPPAPCDPHLPPRAARWFVSAHGAGTGEKYIRLHYANKRFC